MFIIAILFMSGLMLAGAEGPFWVNIVGFGVYSLSAWLLIRGGRNNE